jgi:hypothetical protein
MKPIFFLLSHEKICLFGRGRSAAEDFDIAELEIELEAEGKLGQFIETCKKIHGRDWSIIRKGAQPSEFCWRVKSQQIRCLRVSRARAAQ